MKTKGYHTQISKVLWGLGLPFLLTISACKLEETSLKAKIYPENGKRDVPVNTVIEVQFSNELGLTQNDIKPDLFSIHECEVNDFGFLLPQQAKAQTEAKPAENTNTDPNATDEDKQKNNEPAKSENEGTKLLSKVNFYYASNFDKEKKIIFVYLAIDPDGNSTPLKPNTTYCVQVKKMKNAKKEKIAMAESHFTTEDSASFDFSSKIYPEFHGDRLAVGVKKESTGEAMEDFILIHSRNENIKPGLLRSKIKLCLKSENVATTEACKNFGEEVPSNIYMLEGLKNVDDLVLGRYNVYAVSPRIKNLVAGQEFKIVIDLDLDKNEEANTGTVEHLFTTDDEASLNWHTEYLDQIKDANGPVYTPHHRFFFIGSGS